MIPLIGPDKIDGLKIWFDASDLSTVNDGRVTNGSNVYKFVDKISGVVCRNNNGVNGPTYSFGGVNGKGAICFGYYAPGDLSLRALTASGVTQFNTATRTNFWVYKPTGKTAQPAGSSNEQYVVTVWDTTRITGGIAAGGYANIAMYIAEDSETYALAIQKQNPSGRYVEGVPGTAPYTGYNTYTEDIPSRSLEGPNSLNKVSIGSARISPSQTKKIGWLKEGQDSFEDFTIPAYTASKYNNLSVYGRPLPPSPLSASASYWTPRGFRLENTSVVVGTTAYISIGAFWPVTSLSIPTGKYPMEGFFCEWLYFDRYLTDSETNTVREYLRRKWFPKK